MSNLQMKPIGVPFRSLIEAVPPHEMDIDQDTLRLTDDQIMHRLRINGTHVLTLLRMFNEMSVPIFEDNLSEYDPTEIIASAPLASRMAMKRCVKDNSLPASDTYYKRLVYGLLDDKDDKVVTLFMKHGSFTVSTNHGNALSVTATSPTTVLAGGEYYVRSLTEDDIDVGLDLMRTLLDDVTWYGAASSRRMVPWDTENFWLQQLQSGYDGYYNEFTSEIPNGSDAMFELPGIPII